MKILKFGGSSIASAANINLVIDIIKSNCEHTKIAVVCSAIDKTTDALNDIATKAQSQDDTYPQELSKLENNHFEIVRELIAINHQSGVLSGVKKIFNELESILEGVFLLKELSPKTSDSILSYGEFLSSFIITKALQCKEIDAVYKNSGELMITNDQYGQAIPIID
ncbi:MAG: bifunctional aspartate kinase/homoserine dehydrogenase I, partial [Wenyingzhuangia sp.]